MNYMNSENNNSVLNFKEINSVLTDNFSDIYSVNKLTKIVTVYKCQNPNLREKEIFNEQLIFDEVAKNYIDNYVLDADKDKMRMAVNFDYVCQQLELVSYFIVHYRVKRQGRILYYYMKCARVGDGDSFQNIIFAFSNEDYHAKHKEIELIKNDYIISSKRKILIIEDDKLTTNLICSILSDDYDFIIAGNGEEGYDLLIQNFQDLSLILLDVIMPVCDSIQFLKKIQDNPLLTAIPVIVLTSNDSQETELTCSNLGAADFIPKPINNRILHSRISNTIKLKESALTLADMSHDELTGLFTEQAFMHYGKIIIQNNLDKKMYLIVAKVKDFKLINTIYGTKKADDLLNYLASVYKKTQSIFILARNNSSFICLNYADVDLNHDKFISLTKEVIKNAPIKGLKIKYGVYENIDKNQTISTIYNCAAMVRDTIMDNYEVDIAYYTKKISDKQIYEQMIEKSFESALHNHEFTVYYQPKLDIKHENVVGAEALVRWIKEDGSLVSPGVFIPIYEHDGQIVKLDQYVFEKVCRLQKRKLDSGEKLFPISVNLSRHSALQDDVVEKYTKIIDSYKIPFSCVPLELTESASVYNEKIKKAAEEFVKNGFSLQIDDFGSGYSSLTSLNQFPFSTLKIDKTLIDHITEDKGKTLVEQVIVLSKLLNLNVVAEGVETQQQLEIIKGMNCDAVQGYIFAKPMSEIDFKNYVDNNLFK